MDNCLRKSSSARISPNQPHYHTLRQTSSHSRLCFSVRRSADSQMDNIWKSTLSGYSSCDAQGLWQKMKARESFLKSMIEQVSLHQGQGDNLSSSSTSHYFESLASCILSVEYRHAGHFLSKCKRISTPNPFDNLICWITSPLNNYHGTRTFGFRLLI